MLKIVVSRVLQVISGALILPTLAFAHYEESFEGAKRPLEEDCQIMGLKSRETIAFGENKSHKFKQDEAGCKSAQHRLKEAQKSWETVAFLDGQFSTVKPASWSILEGLNEAADLQMGNLAEEAYCIVLSEAKIDYEEDFTLEEYSQLTRQYLLEGMANASVSEESRMILNGHSALKYELTGSIDKVRIRYWHVSIDAGNHFHQVILWSLPSKFESNRADYEKVLNSFSRRF